MKSLRIHASTEYEVQVGCGLLAQLGGLARSVNAGTRALIVTEPVVRTLYADRAAEQLAQAGYRVQTVTVPSGECAKTAEVWLSVIHCLAEHSFSRADLIVAVGGGTVSDLAGFCAACYLRGIDWLAVPTTLLAAVDASVGGKTGIDLPQGKNLIGTFYPPRMILCDPDTLNTLPQSVLSDGLAEVIKYGMIADAELLTLLHNDLMPQMEEIVCRCIAIKRDLVEQDERDNGIRRLLNFGHTVGHAIEVCSAYRISHGKAVAIGMAAMTKLSEHCGFCTDGIYQELYDLLTDCGLPTALPFSAKELWQAALADKKRQEDTICLVLPVRRGQCLIRPFSTEDFRSMLEICETL